MKKRSQIASKGIVSTYFLAMFLYITSIISILVITDINRMKTIMNMKEANVYLDYESLVIQDLKCRLLNNDLEERSIYLDSCDYTFELYDTLCHVYLYGEVEEELIITLSPSTNKILKYESIRYGS